MRALIIVPTFNEVENLEKVIRFINAQAWTMELDILVVDDKSSDGTGELAEKMALTVKNLHVLRLPNNIGFGPTYREGFRWGLYHNYDWLIEMDADLSHDVAALAAHQNLMTTGQVDCLVGSRYITGGGSQGRTLLRRMTSWLGNHLAQTILRIPLRDVTGGFNAWNQTLLKRMSIETLSSKGFAIQIELKHRAVNAGARFFEFPILFIERRAGASKMSFRISMEGLQTLKRLFLDSPPSTTAPRKGP